jgi:hypothetical protein
MQPMDIYIHHSFDEALVRLLERLIAAVEPRGMSDADQIAVLQTLQDAVEAAEAAAATM